MHHRIPEAVDLKHGTSYVDIAKARNVDQSFLERMIRFCTHDLIFQELVPGHVSHTVSSAALVTDTGLRALVYLNVEDTARACTKLIEAQEKWPNSEESTHSPWNVAYDTNVHVFASRSGPNYEEWAKAFSDMMEYDNKQPLYNLRHAVEAYDWHNVDETVDIGGGTGDLGLALANAYDNLQVYAADREGTIATGTASIPSMPRLHFVACDFFAPLPKAIAHKKIYLLRRILHDWSDKFSVKIIHNLLPALKSGAKMLVMDMVLPEPGALPESLDRTIRGSDLLMKHVLNGKERSKSEWQRLFTSVDRDLVIISTARPEGSAMSLMEVGLEKGGVTGLN
ncbi:O-methyltransferase AMT9 [Fulvia fulva]|uniref:O-methyltransferase AMT9 n=1 Tax=Passalora fulva TaxID=5499 RepID=A0A9Q8PL13_PASFU|nr:O-methyltransferase AMT9 [Fulvia fulva]KAK4610331.1 O-methyltransferase AMT9 [Fulvia fulva]KAK4611401.1 O-methyltransferase AMT9 [Fulvia fulva]UJO24380.1 O-methyltransferase AMT9 [Fulvia fulva]WPV21821.1 O-methyltransferase AMT9 [Fulvia fulva]WPV36833.1 O-methyltransferase AMT9 [Fulvia fulva]